MEAKFILYRYRIHWRVASEILILRDLLPERDCNFMQQVVSNGSIDFGMLSIYRSYGGIIFGWILNLY